MATIFLAGATGFIGNALVRSLAERGDHCIVLSRGNRSPWPDLPVEIVAGNPTVAGPWEKHLDGSDVVVNLAGERIVDPPHRWTADKKQSIRASRLRSTHNVVTAIRSARKPPRALLNASAIGFYGSRGSEIVTEETPAGTDFLASVCTDWEAAAREASDRTRVTLLRSGIVLGQGGGALAPLMMPFKLGMGGPWGTGDQWWSWIHLVDEVRLILLAMDRDLDGPINLTAPNPVTVTTFAHALGKALHRPALVRIPEAALKLGLGEAADALLHLQRVIPERVTKAGYSFCFSEIDQALTDIVRS